MSIGRYDRGARLLWRWQNDDGALLGGLTSPARPGGCFAVIGSAALKASQSVETPRPDHVKCGTTRRVLCCRGRMAKRDMVSKTVLVLIA